MKKAPSRILKFLFKKNQLKVVDREFVIPFEKRNKELYIFGNGYSLSNLDFSSWENRDIFVCNEIFRHDDFFKLKSQNNLLHFVMDSVKVFEEITPKRLKISTALAYANRLNPVLELDHPLVLNKTLKTYVSNNYPNRNFIPHDALYGAILEKLNKQFSALLDGFDIRHTPHLMILTGLSLGYNKIHLYGLEHNYVKDILNKDPKCGTHFYGETYKEVLEFNNGRNLSRTSYKVKLSSLFDDSAKTFKVYETLSDLASEMGVEVTDHSEGSLFMFQDYSLWDLVEPKDKN